MARYIEAAIERLHELLPLVVRDAERYRNSTELVNKCRELHLAARAIDGVLPPPSLASGPAPVIRIRIGENAVEAYGIRKLPYDFPEVYADSAQPGETYDLRFKFLTQTDVFNPKHMQPIYGQLRYFDLATIGRTLEEGGELSISEPEPRN